MFRLTAPKYSQEISWSVAPLMTRICDPPSSAYGSDNEARTHLSLHKDAPVSRGVQAVGRILCLPILGGLHHQYVRI
jgi:hypothetical protein